METGAKVRESRTKGYLGAFLGGGLYCAPQVPTGTSRNQADSDRNFLSRVPAK